MKNKIVAIGTLSLLTLLSFGKNITNANALDITDPEGWTWKYDYDATNTRFEFTDYREGADGVELPYTNPSSGRYEFDIEPTNILFSQFQFPLRMKLVFYASNTSWRIGGGSHYPDSTVQLIGSTAATSSLKFASIFYNPTDTWFQLGMNLSDSDFTTTMFYDVGPYSPSGTAGGYIGLGSNGEYASIVHSRTSGKYDIYNLAPYSQTLIYLTAPTTDEVLFRSLWIAPNQYSLVVPYDQAYDAGLVAGYQEGYIVGYDDGTDVNSTGAITRIGNLMTSVFNGVSSVFNIKIFDQLTIGSVLLFPLAFGIFTFIFRLIRGGKA
jgi:YD repeat-containing protein